MKRDIESFGKLYGKTHEALLGEGILRLPSSIISQIEHEVIPGIRKLCIRDNITNSAIINLPRLLSPYNVANWAPDYTKDTPGLIYRCPDISITGKPIKSDTSKTWPIHLVLHTISDMANIEGSYSRGAYDATEEAIRVSVLSVLSLSREDVEPVYSMILSRGIDPDFLEFAEESQNIFTTRIVQGLSTKSSGAMSMTAAIQKTFGFKKLQETLEHELIHAIDPTVSSLNKGVEAAKETHQAVQRFAREQERLGKTSKEIYAMLKDVKNFNKIGVDPDTVRVATDFKKNRERYTGQGSTGYLRATGLYSGKTPIEFNSFFWNMIRKYDTPLSEQDKKELITFIKSPRDTNIPTKLKDFKLFIKTQLMYKNTRRKFLQRLGAWVTENSYSQELE